MQNSCTNRLLRHVPFACLQTRIPGTFFRMLYGYALPGLHTVVCVSRGAVWIDFFDEVLKKLRSLRDHDMSFVSMHVRYLFACMLSIDFVG